MIPQLFGALKSSKMKLFTVKNVGEVSLNTDLVPWELPPEYITYGINFRAVNKSLFAYFADNPITPTDTSGYFGARLVSTSYGGQNFILAMGRTAVKVFNYINWSDISSFQGYAGIGLNQELLWTSTLLGSIPIINSPQARLEYWSPQATSNKLKALPFSPANTITAGSFVVGKQYTIKTLGTTNFTLVGAASNTVGVTFVATGAGAGTGTATDLVSNTWHDKNYKCNVIRAHKQFLFALGLIENGVEQFNSYRWSHPADVNGIPFTWDETDLSAIAGKDAIGADSGDIIDGSSAGDRFCIYSERGIVALDFVGDEFVWRKRPISSIAGLLNRDCVVEVDGVNYFISNGDIVLNDGFKVTSVMNNRIRKNFASSVSTDTYKNSYALKLKHEHEIWFCVPITGSTYPNIAYVYNWLDDTWSVKDIPSDLSYLTYSKVVTNTDQWDSAVGIWDTDPDIWNGVGDSPFLNSMIGVAPSNGAALRDIFFPAYSDPINAVIERTGLMFNGNDVGVTTITRIYPHVKGSGQLSIEIGSHDFASGAVRWKPPRLYVPDQDRKIDIRTTGELHAYRIKSLDNNFFTFNGITFEYEDNGVR